MVITILKEAGIFDLLMQKKITRMPVLPEANYDDHPEMIEVSSSDEEVDEIDEPDEETTTPTARGPRAEQTSGETDAGAGDIEIEEEEDDMGGQPSEAKKRRTEVRDIRDRFEKLIFQTHQMFNIVSFVVEGMTLMNVPHQMTRT